MFAIQFNHNTTKHQIKMFLSWFNTTLNTKENLLFPTKFNSPFITATTIISFLIIIYNIYLKIIKKDSRHFELLSKFPTIPHVPWLVPKEFLTITPEGMLPLFTKWIHIYGRVISGWILNKPYVLLFKADHVEKILSSSQQINRSDDYDVIIPWGGRSIVTISGHEWHARKKLIQPAFHFKNFDSFIDIFNEQANILVQQLKCHQANEKGFDVVPFTKKCALDMICEAGLGVKVNAQTSQHSEFLEAAEKIGKLISDRWLKPYLRINWLWKILPNGWQQRKCLKVLHGFTRNAVETRIATRKEGSSREKRAAFLDLLLDLKDGGAEISMQTILDESNIFINAGHETTALSIAWCLFLIGANQDVQNRVYEELTTVLGHDKDRAVQLVDISKLKYLECCIKETHRLCAPVPIMARKLTQDCLLDNGLIIPSGAVTVMSIYHIQRDPDYFTDPTKFYPERFECPTSLAKVHPYSFIPFSAGPRNCIGKKVGEMEVKIVLAHVLRNYKLESMIKFEDTRPYPAAVLFPSTGLPIRIFER